MNTSNMTAITAARDAIEHAHQLAELYKQIDPEKHAAVLRRIEVMKQQFEQLIRRIR